MKNLQLTQHEAVYKALIITALVGSFAMAGGVGWMLTPVSYSDNIQLQFQLPFINFAISVGIALFVWSTFKLVEPLRYNRNWQISKFIFVPLVWMLLLAAIDVGIKYVIQVNQDALYFITS